MKKGYGTYEFADGNTYIGQYMQDVKHGYGIFRWTADRELHQGQWKFGKQEGYGYYSWYDGDEYYGQFKDDKRHGEGVKQQ